jgi:hypothetical protein
MFINKNMKLYFHITEASKCCSKFLFIDDPGQLTLHLRNLRQHMGFNFPTFMLTAEANWSFVFVLESL